MSRRTVVVLAAVLAAVLLASTLLAVAGVFGLGDGASSGAPKPPASFNAEGLPPIHTDACPTADELLAVPVGGGRDHLPDLELECIGEVGATERVPLRRIGKLPTVVNLWGSWCGPCRQEMPDLQRTYGAMRGKVRLLGINTADSAEGARATINQTQITWPSLADPDSKVRDAVGPPAMPTTLFITADGRIAHRKYGRLDEDQLRELIAEHLGVRL